MVSCLLPSALAVQLSQLMLGWGIVAISWFLSPVQQVFAVVQPAGANHVNVPLTWLV